MAPKPAREREIEEDRVDLEDDQKPNVDTLLDDPDDEGDGEDNTKARRQQERDPPRREASDDDEDTDQDARLAYDDDEGDGPSERGDSRRKRRNRARRERAAQSDAQINAMGQRIQQLEAALGDVSTGQVRLAAGDIDGQIGAVQSQLDTIDNVMSKAVAEADGETHRKAMRLRDEAVSRLQSLNYEKNRLAASIDPRRQQQQQQQQERRPAAPTAQAPDPAAVRYSEIFMERHPWFDPNDPSDEDSVALIAIENAMALNGSLPKTKRHWVELERRIKARGLGDSGNDGEDMDDEQEERPAPRRNSGGLPPRSGRGAGRRGGGNSVTLPAFARETLDEMNLLDTKGLTKEQLAQRSKLITQWDKGLKEAASGGRR